MKTHSAAAAGVWRNRYLTARTLAVPVLPWSIAGLVGYRFEIWEYVPLPVSMHESANQY